MKQNYLTSFLVWVGGFDNMTAAQCTTSEIRKMSIAGSMVLIPAILALFSYGYGFYFIFQNPYGAIGGGVIAAIILFIIDRSIMTYGRPGKLSLGLFGRVLLAVTVGFLIAEPLILKIFEDSIQEQQYTILAAKKEKINEDYDLKVQSVENGLNPYENRLKELQVAYTSEMDGTGGSGEKNQGPIYAKKLNDYNEYKKVYDAQHSKIQTDIGEVNKQRAEALSLVEDNEANGLIGRVRALSSLGEKETIVHWTTWLLRIFFLLIELLPMLIKISPSGDRGLYYKLVDMHDEENEKMFVMSSEERIKVKQQEEKLRLTQTFAELCLKETQVIANLKEKDSVFLMTKVQELTDKKLDFVAKALNMVQDKTILAQVLSKFDEIHNGFLNTIQELIAKSNANYSVNK